MVLLQGSLLSHFNPRSKPAYPTLLRLWCHSYPSVNTPIKLSFPCNIEKWNLCIRYFIPINADDFVALKWATIAFVYWLTRFPLQTSTTYMTTKSYKYLRCSKNFLKYNTCTNAININIIASNIVHCITVWKVTPANIRCLFSRSRMYSWWSDIVCNPVNSFELIVSKLVVNRSSGPAIAPSRPRVGGMTRIANPTSRGKPSCLA